MDLAREVTRLTATTVISEIPATSPSSNCGEDVIANPPGDTDQGSGALFSIDQEVRPDDWPVKCPKTSSPTTITSEGVTDGNTKADGRGPNVRKGGGNDPVDDGQLTEPTDEGSRETAPVPATKGKARR